ncbi:MAG: 6-phosphogluconate dehydrogenase NAD-binding protein [Acidobacteriales bacterium]|nr:6-phosphogluconate dehydrogenase NAD-binding protein [Terriglobales bacterium]
MRVGFIGLGNMGQAMARNLIRAGHQLVLYNRTRERADALAKEGAEVADSPATAAKQEVAITMLADDNALQSVIFGPNGIIQGMQPGGMHVSMSTISPALSQRLSAAHRERGQRYLAAPVFGRPEAAAAGKLTIVAAGPPDAVAKAKPLFDVLGERTFEVSEEPQHANLIKISGNFLIACVIESLGEVFALSRKAGLDPQKPFDVFSKTLFNAPVYKIYGPQIIEGKFSPPGFKLPLGLKDIRLMYAAADQLAVPMPFANVVHDNFLSAIANGHGDLDWSALALVAEERAGVTGGRAA